MCQRYWNGWGMMRVIKARDCFFSRGKFLWEQPSVLSWNTSFRHFPFKSRQFWWSFKKEYFFRYSRRKRSWFIRYICAAARKKAMLICCEKNTHFFLNGRASILFFYTKEWTKSLAEKCIESLQSFQVCKLKAHIKFVLTTRVVWQMAHDFSLLHESMSYFCSHLISTHTHSQRRNILYTQEVSGKKCETD